MNFLKSRLNISKEMSKSINKRISEYIKSNPEKPLEIKLIPEEYMKEISGRIPEEISKKISW